MSGQMDNNTPKNESFGSYSFSDEETNLYQGVFDANKSQNNMMPIEVKFLPLVCVFLLAQIISNLFRNTVGIQQLDRYKTKYFKGRTEINSDEFAKFAKEMAFIEYNISHSPEARLKHCKTLTFKVDWKKTREIYEQVKIFKINYFFSFLLIFSEIWNSVESCEQLAQQF